MSPFRYVFWKSYREAGHLAEQAQKILDHQRDLLTPARITELESAISHLESMRTCGTRDDIAAAMNRLRPRRRPR